MGIRPEQPADPDPPTIHCQRHGVSASCIICRHLRAGSGLGYWAIEPEPGEPAQAWCEQCDVVLQQDRGWTDRGDAFADWQVYCSKCYAETLARHDLRGWCEGGPSPDG